jgi:hypothetical protein
MRSNLLASSVVLPVFGVFPVVNLLLLLLWNIRLCSEKIDISILWIKQLLSEWNLSPGWQEILARFLVLLQDPMAREQLASRILTVYILIP